METGKAIYNILSNADLSGGATVHPELAPEGTAFPFVVYSIQNIRPSDVKGSTSSLDESTLEVYTMSNDYGQCMTVAAEVRTALDRNAGTFSDVEVQSINFDTGEISYNEPQECFFVEQIYSVRILRVGQAPAADLLPLNSSSLQIQEADASPQAYCTRLIFPNGSLSIDSSGGAGSGIATYAPVYEWKELRPDTTWMQGGGQQIDFSSSSWQTLPFDYSLYSSGTGISTTAAGQIMVPEDGPYRITVNVIFATDTSGHRMQARIFNEDRAFPMFAEGMGLCFSYAGLMESGRRIYLQIRNAGSGSTIYAESAHMTVERMG